MKNSIKFFALFTLIVLFSCTAFAVPSVVTTGDTGLEYVPDITDEEQEAVLLVGEGTEESPYEITCTVEFNNFSSLVKSNNSEYGDKYYKICSNIDFSTVNLVPFGTMESPFTGTIDGNGYALYNVTVPDTFYSGIVGYTTGCTVKNLKVSYAGDGSRKNYSNIKYFGGIIGYAEMSVNNALNVYGCETKGNVVITTSSSFYGGGVFGYLKVVKNEGNVNDCMADISLDVNGSGGAYFGGFVAYQFNGSNKNLKIKNCVSYGNITANINSYEVTAGGFAGYVNKDAEGWSDFVGLDASLAATVYNFENCVSLGNVNVKSNSVAKYGAFTGTNAGEGSAAYSNCYYDKAVTVAAESKTTKQCTSGIATSVYNFNDVEFLSGISFDFENKWYLSAEKLHVRGVLKSEGAGKVSDKKDVRLTSKSGLRFMATLDASKRDYSFEYGFIVARKDDLAGKELTFDFEGRKVWGIAFDSTTDKFVDKDDNGVTISGVVTNIPKEGYGTELVARTYIKFTCDGKQEIVYSDPQFSSINLSALDVRNSESYEYLADEQKAILETMLPEA